MKTLSIIILMLLSLQGCGWFKKSKSKSDQSSGATEIDPDSLVNPDKRSIGPGSTGAELALARFHPAIAHACDGQLANPSYQELIDTLGGVRFGRALTFYRNEYEPYLVVPYVNSGDDGGDMDKMSPEAATANDASQEDSAAGGAEPVDIKRADLIGNDGSRVLFLSKTHGLFFVETAGEKPTMTCTIMVPGEAKNFYIVNSHLILIANGSQYGGSSAIIVYAISPTGLAYKSHHVLQNQNIYDSRLFNDTLVTYAQLVKPNPNQTDNGGGPVEIDYADDSIASSEPYYDGGYSGSDIMVTAFNQITEQPKVIFEDLLASQKEDVEQKTEYVQADLNKTVSRWVQYKDFISASDRYFVITKQVSETYIARFEERTYNYRICTNYNPKAQEIRHNYCQPIWEKVANPSFDPNFSCHTSADFAQCVQTNETKFVKAYWNYKGSSCQEHSYWIGRCEQYESKTVVTMAPVYENRTTSHLMIYKYENGSFIRFDDPNGAEPITVSGAVKEHKSLQFRDGYMMIVTTDLITGTALRSYKLAEKALVFAGSVENMGPREDMKAVVFTESLAYVVTFLQKDPLFRIDLTDPAKPVLTGALDVEGFSSQLIPFDDKLIGLGTTADWQNNYVKVSLFEVAPESFMSEITSIELGKDLDQSYNNSATDDQLHHWVPSAGRLYVPYTGWYQKQASDTFSKVCPVGYHYPRHRLSVLSVGANLNEAADLEFRGNIERVLEHSEGRALAFSSGSVNSVVESSGTFNNDTVKELYQTEGVYTDKSLPHDWVVAKQVVRSGGQLFKMRFVLGNRDQLVQNQPAQVVEVSDDLVSCLGEPEIMFFDNELFIGHNLRHMREGYDGGPNQVEIQISGYLGWKISEAGFQAMNDAELAAFRARQPNYCFIRPGVAAPTKWEEMDVHLQHVDEFYECKLGRLDRPGQVINY